MNHIVKVLMTQKVTTTQARRSQSSQPQIHNKKQTTFNQPFSVPTLKISSPILKKGSKYETGSVIKEEIKERYKLKIRNQRLTDRYFLTSLQLLGKVNAGSKKENKERKIAMNRFKLMEDLHLRSIENDLNLCKKEPTTRQKYPNIKSKLYDPPSRNVNQTDEKSQLKLAKPQPRKSSSCSIQALHIHENIKLSDSEEIQLYYQPQTISVAINCNVGENINVSETILSKQGTENDEHYVQEPSIIREQYPTELTLKIPDKLVNQHNLPNGSMKAEAPSPYLEFHSKVFTTTSCVHAPSETILEISSYNSSVSAMPKVLEKPHTMSNNIDNCDSSHTPQVILNCDDEASKIPNEKWSLMDNIGFPPPFDCTEEYAQYMNSDKRRKYFSECKGVWQEYFMTSNNGCKLWKIYFCVKIYSLNY